MSLFGFGDITFNKEQSKNSKGPLSALEKTPFEKNSYRYPLDIGNYDKGHYMVIYIKQQNNTSFPAQITNFPEDGSSSTNKQTLNGNVGNISSNFGGGLLSKVNGGLNKINASNGGQFAGITNSLSQGLSGALGKLNGVSGKIGNLFGQTSVIGGSSGSTQAVLNTSIKRITNKNFVKTTTLTTDAIALYMPDTLLYSYSQNFETVSPGNEASGKILAAGRSALEAKKAGASSFEAIMKAGAPALEGAAKNKGVDIVADVTGQAEGGKLAKAFLGQLVNPMLELIYQAPNMREFQFDFMFYPRDEKEALEVQKIIERLRFHQAPEFAKMSLSSATTEAFLMPPSQFDIRFYYGGSENINLPPISTCVLKSIDVNYAPNGWSAYEVPGEPASLGRTGMPVATQLTLQFQETTYLTKADFNSELVVSKK